VSIAAFDFEFEILSRWTDSRASALTALSELIRPKAIGGTEFYRSLERALRQEFRNVSGRKAIVVLSDGRDTGLYRRLVQTNSLPEPAGEREFQRTFRTALERRIPTYFIAVNTDRNFEPNVQGGDEYRNLQKIFAGTDMAKQYLAQVRLRMQQISEVTGGRILYPKSMEDIIPLYAQIGRELGTAYSLGYSPSSSGSRSAYRRIEVRLKDSRLRLEQSRAGYYVR
jgi:VWFA-related protein